MFRIILYYILHLHALEIHCDNYIRTFTIQLISSGLSNNCEYSNNIRILEQNWKIIRLLEYYSITRILFDYSNIIRLLEYYSITRILFE
jgi:hypothetical protein